MSMKEERGEGRDGTRIIRNDSHIESKLVLTVLGPVEEVGEERYKYLSRSKDPPVFFSILQQHRVFRSPRRSNLESGHMCLGSVEMIYVRWGLWNFGRGIERCFL
jgi:hypothetical protein